MLITHKIFLYWLLYLSIVLFGTAISLMVGLPQLVLNHDHSYLSVVLIGMYVVAEILAGKQAIWVSKLHRTVNDSMDWFKSNKVISIKNMEDGSVTLYSDNESWSLKPGPFTDLIVSLRDKSRNGKGGYVEQRALIDAFVENLDRRTNIGDFIASRIVWVGILATIVGVIMAFWPFQQQGMSIDAMRSHLGDFFSGVAVAFIPTAVSFVFKIILDFNTKIIQDGISEIIETVTVTGASYIVPHLEKGSVNG